MVKSCPIRREEEENVFPAEQWYYYILVWNHLLNDKKKTVEIPYKSYTTTSAYLQEMNRNIQNRPRFFWEWLYES